MIANVPPEVLLSAASRGVMFLIVLGVTARWWKRKPTVGAIVLLSLGAIALTLSDQRELAALLSIPNAGLICEVLVAYVRDEPQQIKHLLAAKEAAWSKQRHDLVNDYASEQARRLIAERELEKLTKPKP